MALEGALVAFEIEQESAAGAAIGLLGMTSLVSFSPAHADDLAANAEAPQSSQTVVVTGQHTTLDIVPQTILDAPQSINVGSSELLQQQAGASLADALKNVPGITLNAGEGGTHGDLVNLRGFSAGDDYFMDGLRDTGLYDRDAFDYRNVEVYKGAASTLFGRGRQTFRENPALGNRSGARLRNRHRRQRLAQIPASAGGHIPDYGVPFLFDRPAPVGGSTFYGLPTDDLFKTKVDVVTGRIQHTFNETWSMSDTARYGHYYFLSRQTAAIDGSANCFPGVSTMAYFTGAPLCAGGSVHGQVPVTANNPFFPVLGTPVSSVDVLRDRPSGSGTIETAMNDLDFDRPFRQRSAQHTLVFGFEYGYFRGQYNWG
jgi:catecholate siderophore receptor